MPVFSFLTLGKDRVRQQEGKSYFIAGQSLIVYAFKVAYEVADQVLSRFKYHVHSVV